MSPSLTLPTSYSCHNPILCIHHNPTNIRPQGEELLRNLVFFDSLMPMQRSLRLISDEFVYLIQINHKSHLTLMIVSSVSHRLGIRKCKSDVVYKELLFRRQELQGNLFKEYTKFETDLQLVQSIDI